MRVTTSMQGRFTIKVGVNSITIQLRQGIDIYMFQKEERKKKERRKSIFIETQIANPHVTVAEAEGKNVYPRTRLGLAGPRSKNRQDILV